MNEHVVRRKLKGRIYSRDVRENIITSFILFLRICGFLLNRASLTLINKISSMEGVFTLLSVVCLNQMYYTNEVERVYSRDVGENTCYCELYSISWHFFSISVVICVFDNG